MNPSFNPTPQQDHHSLAESVLSRIEKEGVRPTPKWQYSVREQLLWGACLFALIVATLSAGAALLAVASSDFDLRKVTHDTVLGFALHTLPWLWLAFLAGSLFAAYENLRHTGRGYRYSLLLLFVVGGVVLCVGGGMVYATGLATKVDQVVAKTTKGKAGIAVKHQKLWTQPEKGLLAGEVITISPDFSTVTVKSFEGDVWTVSGEDLQWKDCRSLLQSKQVRFVGLPTVSHDGEKVFHACFALPWEKPLQKKRPLDPQTIDAAYLKALDERKLFVDRSTDCKGLRPYEFLQSLRNEEALIQ